MAILTLEELSRKWLLLSVGENIKSVRIDSSTIPDLFIGFHPDGRRCLVLQLPSSYKADFQSSIKQNLSLELFPQTRWVILTLLDSQYSDLFDDLIFSIYYKIWALEDPALYVGELLKTYYKWSEFFQNRTSTTLSEEAIRGMFGELVYLRERLDATPALQVNDLLRSWKGPYDTGHDFITDDKDVEVKTRIIDTNIVHISSESQLMEDAGKQLTLVVVSIKPNLEGSTLREVVVDSADKVIHKLGDFTIILRALAQKGITVNMLSAYDHLRFHINDITAYSCTTDGFPRITSSLLPTGVTHVSYKLNLSALKPFMIERKEFYGNTGVL